MPHLFIPFSPESRKEPGPQYAPNWHLLDAWMGGLSHTTQRWQSDLGAENSIPDAVYFEAVERDTGKDLAEEEELEPGPKG